MSLGCNYLASLITEEFILNWYVKETMYAFIYNIYYRLRHRFMYTEITVTVAGRLNTE
jgi:hypothetical protein